MILLLDPGHGIDTPGKRSPDGLFREYSYNREIVQLLYSSLMSRVVSSHQSVIPMIVVPEPEDISLKERCSRVNKICKEHGKSNILLVSIHVNASGRDNKWHDATGWSAYTSRGHTKADTLAECFYDAARTYLQGKKIRTDMFDGDQDIEENFYILRHTLCPAVLTENFFQDNKSDVEFLQSEDGKRAIVNIHIEGIIKYLSQQKE